MLLSLLLTLLAPSFANTRFDRVLVVVLENTDYADAMRDPYLKSLAAQGALMTNFNAEFHPSYPNYLAMIGGRFFGTVMDQQKNIDAPHIGDLLEAKGLSWKQYAEGYPGGCFLGSARGRYARKHVPFLSFVNVQRDPRRCAQVVDSTQFQKDVQAGQLANLMFYTPDMDNDGHDTDLATASRWLRGFLTPLLSNPAFMDRTLIEVTFDESKSYSNNHIYTLFLGSMVKRGFTDSTDVGHYAVLRTLEDNLGLGTLGGEDSRATPLRTIWAE